MNLNRIEHTQLDITDDFLVLWKGKPFDGISYEMGSNNELLGESSYLNGRQNGSTRSWYSSGKLKSEKNYQDGYLHGVTHNWFENGKVKSESLFEFGILVSKKEWNLNGDLTDEYEISDNDLHYDLLIARRQQDKR